MNDIYKKAPVSFIKIVHRDTQIIPNGLPQLRYYFQAKTSALAIYKRLFLAPPPSFFFFLIFVFVWSDDKFSHSTIIDLLVMLLNLLNLKKEKKNYTDAKNLFYKYFIKNYDA